MRFRAVLRCLSAVAISACVLAVTLGRAAPRGAAVPIQRDAHRRILNSYFFKRSALDPTVLDTETGTQSAFPGIPGESLQWASFSGWLDESGEWQVVGRCVPSRGNGDRGEVPELGLARLSYPSGRLLDWITDCPLPDCPPCWFPGPVPRVLFAATDGRLYECVFQDDGAELSEAASSVEPVVWTPRAPQAEPVVKYVVWPEALNGLVIASVNLSGSRFRRSPQRLWWLRLSPDGTSVADAGPIESDSAEDDATFERCLPTVALGPGGVPWIAYQLRRDRGRIGDLVMAPLVIDAQTPAVTIRTDAERTLARRILSVPPAFSPDGAWLYAVQELPGEAPAVRRFAVEDEQRRSVQ